MSFKIRRDKAIAKYFPDSPDEETVRIPDGVLRITYKSFFNCTNLKVVYLPDSVYSIEDKAFEGCSNLLEIYAPGVVCVSPNSFNGCSKLRVVDFPLGDNIPIINKLKQQSRLYYANIFSKIYKFYPGDIVLLRPHTFIKGINVPPDESGDRGGIPKHLLARLAIISEVNNKFLYSVKILFNQGCATRVGMNACFIERKLCKIDNGDVDIWVIDTNIQDLISYILSQHKELLEECSMKITAHTVNLISDIEELVASHCYNPNSYDIYNGIEGAAFRYPLTYLNEGRETKTRNNIKAQLSDKPHQAQVDIINGMKYKFGSNHLYIGEAIIDILNMIEERYGISFEELERQKYLNCEDT